MSRIRWSSGLAGGLRFVIVIVVLATDTTWLYAQSDADFDEYKVRISGFLTISGPKTMTDIGDRAGRGAVGRASAELSVPA